MAKYGHGMTDAELRADALRNAEKVVQISIEDASRLPGMLGPMVSGQLRYRGWAPVLLSGVKTFYEVTA